MNNREDEWMVRYQSGEEDALELIYTALKPPLYSFIYRYSRDKEMSIDIVQDTFVTLQQNKDKYDPAKGKLKSYLFQIAYRLMVNKLNRRKKLRTFLPFLIPISDVYSLDTSDRMTIREAIAKLPDIHRAVVLLYYYHDMSQEEISIILQIPIGTVKSRLYKSIQTIKTELGGDFHESRSF